MEVTPEDRWKVFIILATNRFERWLAIWGDREDEGADRIPLDVALIWHTWVVLSSFHGRQSSD